MLRKFYLSKEQKFFVMCIGLDFIIGMFYLAQAIPISFWIFLLVTVPGLVASLWLKGTQFVKLIPFVILVNAILLYGVILIFK
jgi:hypothetical protein